MGLWAGIKHALNSTLGTDNFKPLNELVRDEILRGNGLIASENIYYPNLINETITYNTGVNYDKEYPFELKFNVNGSADLRVDSLLQGVKNGKLEIYKNGEYYASISLPKHVNSEPYVRIQNISFSMYDVFTFRILGFGDGGFPYMAVKLDVYADIINYSGITITNI